MTQPGLPVIPGGIPAETPYLKLPRAVPLFQARAARLRELAEGHKAGDWLRAMAAVCEAQRAAAEEIATATEVVEFRAMTPLAEVDWRGGGAFRKVLARLLGELDRADLPEPSRRAITAVRAADEATVDGWAASLLDGEAGPSARPEPAIAVLVGAALQVRFATLAEHLPATSIARAERDCPVCGAPAQTGLVTGDDKVRYLTCSRCASAWHRVRVECATCGEPGGVSYYTLEEDPGAAGTKAEACDRCHTYLKLFYQEQRPYAEPLADDLATIALDLLMGEGEHARGGMNLLLGA